MATAFSKSNRPQLQAESARALTSSTPKRRPSSASLPTVAAMEVSEDLRRPQTMAAAKRAGESRAS